MNEKFGETKSCEEACKKLAYHIKENVTVALETESTEEITEILDIIMDDCDALVANLQNIRDSRANE